MSIQNTLESLARRFTAAIVVCITAGCGSDSTEPPRVVASVVITGSPTTPLLEGSTVTLTATPVDAHGDAVPGASVVWKSSDESIATITSAGVVNGLGIGAVTISATSGTIAGSAPLTVRAGTSMTTDGGTLSALSGAVKLTVPVGALAQTEMMYVSGPPTTLPPDARFVPGTAFTVGTDPAAPFGRSLLQIAYDPAKFPGGVNEASLQLYMLSDGTWTLVAHSTVQPETHSVSGLISESATYAIVGTAVDHITLDNGLINPLALLVGRTRTIAVAAFDAADNALAGRSGSWQSSDPNRATVTDRGVVTGISAGNVTITATVEGKSASTPITIVGPVTADWSQAEAWTTFQGSGTHTGYMAVTIDPLKLAHYQTLFPSGYTNTELSYAVPFLGMAIFNASSTPTRQANSIGVNTPSTPPGNFFSFTSLGNSTTVGAPTAANGSIYVQTMTTGNSSRLWILDEHGRPRTFVDFISGALAYPGPVATTQAVFIVCGNPVGVCAMDPSTGALKWFRQTNASDQWSPAVANDVVYTYTGVSSAKVQAFAAATGQPLYEIPDPHFLGTSASMDVVPAIGADNDLLITQGGRLVSFDLAGKAVRWEVAGKFAGNVTIANGVLYARNDSNVEARRESDGSLLWAWTPPERATTNSVVATKNLLFVSSLTNTHAVDIATQATVFTWPTPGRLSITAEGVLLISQKGSLTQIKLK